MSGVSEATHRAADLFSQRHADWLRLRADIAKIELEKDFTDDQVARSNALDEQLMDLERLLMTTRAMLPWMIWRKFEVLEQTIVEEDIGRADRAEVWMVAGIKADLLALGIGEDAAVTR